MLHEMTYLVSQIIDGKKSKNTAYLTVSSVLVLGGLISFKPDSLLESNVLLIT